MIATAQANQPGALPPTPEVVSLLSESKLLWDLSGTIQEKSQFAAACGVGCV
jgi:hypothetical protein